MLQKYIFGGCKKCGGTLGPLDEEGDRTCINCGAYALRPRDEDEQKWQRADTGPRLHAAP